MKENEYTRNDDIELMCRLWVKYYPQYIVQDESGVMLLPFKSIRKLPTLDSITRCRRKIQETELHPTDIKIVRRRRQNIDRWKEAMGYPTT